MSNSTPPTKIPVLHHDGNSKYFPTPKDLKPSESQLNGSEHYPLTADHRAIFRTKSGKQLTPHQWAVYDFALTIPRGKVTTYKQVSLAVGGSPRSVGNALRNNPFSPHVPCHRVIASDLFIGGFCGEWGKNHKTGQRCNDKIKLLSQEGVNFSESGHLLDTETTVWCP